MKNEHIEIKGLTKKYNSGMNEELIALDNVNLSISEGDFITIIGNNAAGKSTLLNLISGTIKPTVGEVYINGNLLGSLNETERYKMVSCVRQNPNDSVINSLTVAENLALIKIKKGKAGLSTGVKAEWRSEFVELLKPLGVGLEKRLDDKIEYLSGGQKQTLALIMATLHKPALLILDEHTAALDPKVSTKLLKITEAVIRKNNITTLMVTHNINQAINYGDRLLILKQGKIISEIIGNEKKSLTSYDIEQFYEEQHCKAIK